MSSLREHLRASLDALRAGGLHRTLAAPEGVDFSSNDYLGVARLPRFRELLLEKLAACPPPSPASRLLRGHLEEHRCLEERLAAWKGTEDALVFSTGYQANLGVLTALLERGDRVLSDAQNHASIIDGIRLSRAEKAVFDHLDVEALERELRRPWPGGRTFVVTESLFSMDGDIAPLDVYADLCERYGASLVIDDAHATGLWGEERGSGLVERFGVERRADAIVSTFGKALGWFGAFVAGPRELIEWLVNRARPFIFTTAPPPELVCGMEAAVEIVRDRPELRRRVHALAGRLREGLRPAGIDCLRSEGPIVPVVVGGNEDALRAAAGVRRRGIDVRAIRPPSVAPGTARLRVSVHADRTGDEVDALRAAVVEELAALRTSR